MTDLRQAVARAIARAFACAFAPFDSPDGAEYWRNNQSRHRAVLVAAMKDEVPVLKQAVINAAIAMVSINHTPNSKAGAELNLRKAVKALQSVEAEIAP
jgi:hypothetical protein